MREESFPTQSFGKDSWEKLMRNDKQKSKSTYKSKKSAFRLKGDCEESKIYVNESYSIRPDNRR